MYYVKFLLSFQENYKNQERHKKKKRQTENTENQHDQKNRMLMNTSKIYIYTLPKPSKSPPGF